MWHVLFYTLDRHTPCRIRNKNTVHTHTHAIVLEYTSGIDRPYHCPARLHAAWVAPGLPPARWAWHTQTSHIWHLTSDISHQTSDIWHQETDIWHLTSNIWHLTSDIWHLASDISHLTSDIWHLTSDIGHLTSDIWHLTSGYWHLTSNICIWRLTSDM
jgi:hypothetical protein